MVTCYRWQSWDIGHAAVLVFPHPCCSVPKELIGSGIQSLACSTLRQPCAAGLLELCSRRPMHTCALYTMVCSALLAGVSASTITHPGTTWCSSTQPLSQRCSDQRTRRRAGIPERHNATRQSHTCTMLDLSQRYSRRAPLLHQLQHLHNSVLSRTLHFNQHQLVLFDDFDDDTSRCTGGCWAASRGRPRNGHAH
jgi:hypothetical protein